MFGDHGVARDPARVGGMVTNTPVGGMVTNSTVGGMVTNSTVGGMVTNTPKATHGGDGLGIKFETTPVDSENAFWAVWTTCWAGLPHTRQVSLCAHRRI